MCYSKQSTLSNVMVNDVETMDDKTNLDAAIKEHSMSEAYSLISLKMICFHGNYHL